MKKLTQSLKTGTVSSYSVLRCYHPKQRYKKLNEKDNIKDFWFKKNDVKEEKDPSCS